MKTVSIEEFGKDHWSLLGYIETCCVDANNSSGKIDNDRMRTNTNRYKGKCQIIWMDKYSTRLKTFPWKSKDEKEKTRHRIDGHDDWDCLWDLEQAGFVNLISYVNGFVQISGEGLAMAAEIRAHKANGGFFSNFTPLKLNMMK